MDAMRGVEDAATSALVALCETRLAQAQAELPALAEAAAPAGAVALMFSPDHGVLDTTGLGPQLGRSLLDLLQAQAQRLQTMGDELLAAQTSLRERKLVERAKGLLMDRRGLGEEAAYKLLRQTAMQQNRRLGEVAESVLQMGPLIAGL
jgi:AmiR/NasT family two-component response regulator